MKRIITLFFFLTTFLGLSQTKEIDSLILELAYKNTDSTKVNTSLNLIKALYNANDFETAFKHIAQTEKLSNTLDYKKGKAETAYYKALIYAQKNDYINAIGSYSKSKTLFAQLQDTLGVAKVNNSIGLIEIKRGNYKKGLEYSLSAIDALENRNLKSELGLAYSNLAKAYHSIEDYDNAIEFNLKALRVQEELNDNIGALITNSNLGSLYSRKREHRKAIEYYEKVLQSDGGNNDSIRAEILPKLGGEYLQFKDYQRSANYLIQGLRLNRAAKNDNGLLISLNNLGDLNLQRSQLRTADAQLREAGALAKSLKNDQELLRNYGLMKSLDSTRRNFSDAFYWQRQYYQLKQDLDAEIISARVKTAIPNDNNSGDALDNELYELEESKATDTSARFDRLQLIFYALLAAFAIVSTFLLLIYLKRSSRVKYTRELEAKNAKIEIQNKAILEQSKHLEDINKVKDKLFSIVSHDLKDSLSSINGFIDLLKDGDLSREEFDNLIPELSENANNASLLLFNLLNWSKSQMQSLEPSPSLFDVQEVFEDKLKLVEQKMDTKGINLIDHTLRDFVYADRSMVEIVVQNLLANAVKFCKMGDTITVSNHISNGSSIISIADTGVGISEENLEKLFKQNSFTTIGTKNEKGTGLGLSICKELVELNKGKIWVDSTQGQGSTFYVQLPKSKLNE